jgi:uncharacterized protein DUF2252
MNIVKATQQYEDWLAQHVELVKADLRRKHRSMAEASFPFLRATYYRWAQVWPEVCTDLAKAPTVLAVGDLHVENFGTWRDAEGRLIWGVNDFDEACILPYTNDLVRLSVSALLSIKVGHLRVKGKAACAAILEGYEESLEKGGRPFVLEEENEWLREIATNELRDPVHFWEEMDGLRPIRGEIPASAREALEQLLPERGLDYKVVHRVAGLGSLGRIRLVAIADWCGGRIAREVKALAPSSACRVQKSSAPTGIQYQTIVQNSVRCPDPFADVRGTWLIRRLSPHCCRIELDDLPKDRHELALLFAMGWETANIHLGSRGAIKRIQRHLHGQKAAWLFSAAKKMAKSVTEDWRNWRKLRPA